MVMNDISYTHAAHGTDAIVLETGCDGRSLRCFFVTWYPIAYDANAPLLPSQDDIATCPRLGCDAS